MLFRSALLPVVEQRDVLQSGTRLGHNFDDLRAALVSEQLEPRIPLALVRAVRLVVLVEVEVEPQRTESRRCREQLRDVYLVVVGKASATSVLLGRRARREMTEKMLTCWTRSVSGRSRPAKHR